MRIYIKNINADKEDFEYTLKKTVIGTSFSVNKDTYTIIPDEGREAFYVMLLELIIEEFLKHKNKTLLMTVEK